MRWEVVPIVFGLAGATGGALNAMLSEALIGKPYTGLEGICAVIGGGFGIGSAMCLSRKAWICLVSSPVFGVAGYLILMAACGWITEGEVLSLKDLLRDEFAWRLAAPAGFVLVAAHHLHLRMRARGISPFVSAASYALMGALSGSVFWVGRELGPGLLNGVLYGLLQHIAMMVSLGVESWRVEPESGSTS